MSVIMGNVFGTANEVDVNEELTKWKIDMYSENPHLFKIPQSRIDQKRRQLEAKANDVKLESAYPNGKSPDSCRPSIKESRDS